VKLSKILPLLTWLTIGFIMSSAGAQNKPAAATLNSLPKPVTLPSMTGSN
jgi:predicted permease